MPIKMKRTQPATTHWTIVNHPPEISSSATRSPDHRQYECKTCHKKFDTFQALGGHQGIHKKLILNEEACSLSLQIAAVPKLHHQCKACKKKFPTGQALGGHMRRHKEELLRRQQEAGEVVDSNFTSAAAVEPRWVEAEEEQRHKLKRELVLAAKELRLSI